MRWSRQYPLLLLSLGEDGTHTRNSSGTLRSLTDDARELGGLDPITTDGPRSSERLVDRLRDPTAQTFGKSGTVETIESPVEVPVLDDGVCIVLSEAIQRYAKYG